MVTSFDLLPPDVLLHVIVVEPVSMHTVSMCMHVYDSSCLYREAGTLCTAVRAFRVILHIERHSVVIRLARSHCLGPSGLLDCSTQHSTRPPPCATR